MYLPAHRSKTDAVFTNGKTLVSEVKEMVFFIRIRKVSRPTIQHIYAEKYAVMSHAPEIPLYPVLFPTENSRKASEFASDLEFKAAQFFLTCLHEML